MSKKITVRNHVLEWRIDMNRSDEIVKIAVKAMDDKKAEDIKVIRIGEVSSVADYFVIANGTNPSQVEAIVDAVEEELTKNDISALRTEGLRSSGWILMDYGDVVIHIFSKEDRLFYDLERIWRDGEIVSIENFQ